MLPVPITLRPPRSGRPGPTVQERGGLAVERRRAAARSPRGRWRSLDSADLADVVERSRRSSIRPFIRSTRSHQPLSPHGVPLPSRKPSTTVEAHGQYAPRLVQLQRRCKNCRPRANSVTVADRYECPPAGLARERNFAFYRSRAWTVTAAGPQAGGCPVEGTPKSRACEIVEECAARTGPTDVVLSQQRKLERPHRLIFCGCLNKRVERSEIMQQDLVCSMIGREGSPGVLAEVEDAGSGGRDQGMRLCLAVNYGGVVVERRAGPGPQKLLWAIWLLSESTRNRLQTIPIPPACPIPTS